MGKFCNQCGKELLEGVAFCGNCGSRLDGNNSRDRISKIVSKIDDRHFLAAISAVCILLIIGTFLPYLKLEMGYYEESYSLMNLEDLESNRISLGFYLLGLGVLCIFWTKKGKKLHAIGVSILAIMICAYIKYRVAASLTELEGLESLAVLFVKKSSGYYVTRFAAYLMLILCCANKFWNNIQMKVLEYFKTDSLISGI